MGDPPPDGAAKAALVEIQSDEYGGGEAERVHAELFAETMARWGSIATYGAYVDRLPGATLATVNLISLFGLHRRWRGALVGHLAAFEISSRARTAATQRPAPPRLRRRRDRLLRRARRGRLGAREHRGLRPRRGSRAPEPELAGDILFGVRALLLSRALRRALLGAWEAGESLAAGERRPASRSEGPAGAQRRICAGRSAPGSRSSCACRRRTAWCARRRSGRARSSRRRAWISCPPGR